MAKEPNKPEKLKIDSTENLKKFKLIKFNCLARYLIRKQIVNFNKGKKNFIIWKIVKNEKINLIVIHSSGINIYTL